MLPSFLVKTSEHMNWTIQKIINWSQNYLQEKGVENPRLDAELLLEEVLSISRIQLYTQWDRPLNADELAKYKVLIKRRAQREPLAYILGKREFYSLDFKVSPAVLVPRPETEELVEHALHFLKAQKEAPLKLLDLYTGSGCILTSLLKHLPASFGTGVDCSAAALELAQINAVTHHVNERVDWLEADLSQTWPSKILEAKFDLITANPPYIAEAEWTTLQEEVQFYEPKIALISGPHGSEAYEAMLQNLEKILAPHGLFICEIGMDQGLTLQQKAQSLLPQWNTSILKDLSGKDRFLKMMRS